MNQHPGVIGRKVGMTHVINEDGTVVPCTVVEARPVVLGKRTPELDGYSALVLGLGERKEKHTIKPLAGYFKKVGTTPKRVVREFRCSPEALAKFEPGAAVNLSELFEIGQWVDVRGTSRGRGFSGVIRRHKFHGFGATHGTHEYKRHGGAIGTRKTPGRTFKGKKMPGHMGNRTVTVLSQRVERVLVDDSLLLISGGIPGARNSLVEVRAAVKRTPLQKAS